MGSEQSAPLPQTSGDARMQAAAGAAEQPSFFTRMMDPYANLPQPERGSQLTRGTHSRSSSVNGAPGASTSHISVSVDLLGDESDDAGIVADKDVHDERKIVEGAMSRIAPPSVAALLAGDGGPGAQDGMF